MQKKLYIGIIIRGNVADVISIGNDYKKVHESTEQVCNKQTELIGQENATFTVTETLVPDLKIFLCEDSKKTPSS